MKKLIFIFIFSFLCCLFGFCDSKSPAAEKLTAKVYLCKDAYWNHRLENSLDGKEDDDYTAFHKLDHPTVFELILSRPVANLRISAVFDSAENYAKDWQVEALDANRLPLFISQVAGQGKKQQTGIYASKPFRILRFTFRDFSGQDRLLLRQLTFTELSRLAAPFPVRGEDFSVKLLYNDPCYDTYGVENSLDGQWADDYTAFTESAVPAHIDLELSKPQKRLNLEIIFESKINYAAAWRADLLDRRGRLIRSIPFKGAGQYSYAILSADRPFKYLRLTFTSFFGQKRLLLRQLALTTDFLSERFSRLDLSGEKTVPVDCSGKSPTGFLSIAKYDKDRYLMIHDGTICSFDAAKNVLTPWEVSFSQFRPQPENPVSFQPSGLTVADGKVYIANGPGDNVLQGRLDPGKKTVVIEREYRRRLSKGPKGVSVDPSGKILYFANQDSGTVIALDLVSGGELWSVPVPQALAVTVDGDHVYATGADRHDLVKIERKSGKVLQTAGSAGWNPARQEFLRPVMVEPCGDTLIVTDADTGFISLVDKKTLQVRKFFGGNGRGPHYFNYPHVAKVLDDELWITSAYRPEIVVLDRKTLKSLRRYVFHRTAPRGEQSEPFGIGWKNYVHYEDSARIPFMGKQYYPGYGLIFHPDWIFNLPLPGSLFNPSSQPVSLLQSRVEGNVTLLWSSSSPYLFMLVGDPLPARPGALFRADITTDSWEDGDCIVTQKERIKFSVLAEQARAKYRRLQQLQGKNRVISPQMMKEFFAGESAPAKYGELFDKAFASYPGVRFKAAYDRSGGDAEKVRQAARLYYGRMESIPYKNLGDWLLVFMLTGADPGDKLFPAPPKVIDPAVSDLRYFKLCLKVNSLKPYGAGDEKFSYTNRTDLRKNIMELKDWNCGHFALQFCLDLPVDAKPVCYGLEQPTSGALHALVEVREPAGVVTYDPTQGCAYRASIEQLREGSVDIENITVWGKEPQKLFTPYQGAAFLFKAKIRHLVKFDEIPEK